MNFINLPYPSPILEKIKGDVLSAEEYLRNIYPQTEREDEIIRKARQLVSGVDFLFERLIYTQEVVKRQAGDIIRMSK